MNFPDILLIGSDKLFYECNYKELSERFCITTVDGTEGLEAALAAQQFDCVLMTGIDSVPAHKALEITSDYGLPVLFRDPNMTASMAVGLTRAGAFHCFGHRDSLDQLLEALDSAAGEDETDSARSPLSSAASAANATTGAPARLIDRLAPDIVPYVTSLAAFTTGERALTALPFALVLR